LEAKLGAKFKTRIEKVREKVFGVTHRVVIDGEKDYCTCN
jgi:hypothetical protein